MNFFSGLLGSHEKLNPRTLLYDLIGKCNELRTLCTEKGIPENIKGICITFSDERTRIAKKHAENILNIELYGFDLWLNAVIEDAETIQSSCSMIEDRGIRAGLFNKLREIIEICNLLKKSFSPR